MWRLTLLVMVPVAADIKIATFDGAESTKLEWETVNDPVMGGSSTSSFEEKLERGVGVWRGEVKKVWFLQKPGFCNLRSSTPPHQHLGGTHGVVARLRQVASNGLTGYRVVFRTSSTMDKERQYQADFTAGPTMEDHFVKWTDFVCTWRGEKQDDCAGIANELDDITSVGIGTAYPGKAGPFEIEIESLVARRNNETIATFDGAESTTLHWETVNDPVMGGSSSSSFDDSERGVGIWRGEVKKVWFLQKPGFCSTRAPIQPGKHLSGTAGVLARMREATPNGLTNFRFSFKTSSMMRQADAYQADITVGTAMEDHFVRWTDFVCTWRGEEQDDCVGLANELDNITSVGLSTSGVAGPFEIEIEQIVALGSNPMSVAHGINPMPVGLASALKTTRAFDMRVFV